MGKVTLTIDNKKVEVEEGTTILKAAEKAGIKIPTLCHMEGINEIGACRICLVEVKGARTLIASCVTAVAEGMEVYTSSPAVLEARRINLELILSNHRMECLTCVRNTNCELQNLAYEMGVTDIEYTGEVPHHEVDTSSPSLVRDPSKCILCRRCVAICEKVQSVSAIDVQERGFDTIVAPAFQEPLGETVCVNCGQCAMVCPTGAIYEKDQSDEVLKALADPDTHVVVQTAPAIRVAIGEEFGLEPGSVVTGQLVAGLRRLGFDKVFDTNFTADLTIVEEGNELLERLKKGGELPVITSCSPGWIKFMEHFYPSLKDNVSTCKSPQQMFGALAKTYYKTVSGIDPSKIYSVSIMPCTAKKFEAGRDEMKSSGYRDVDAVLTTRELARLFKRTGINLPELEEENYDEPMGIASGAGAIFGNTGGVMEAALRTCYELVTGETLSRLEFEDVRGMEGVKKTQVSLNGTTLRVAVAHGLGNARQLLDAVVNGEKYHFIEIMTCPGGCIGGGGQPIPTNTDTREKRIAGLYDYDESLTIRKSHENPAVKTLYETFLGEPLGEKSHELLHTHYTARSKY